MPSRLVEYLTSMLRLAINVAFYLWWSQFLLLLPTFWATVSLWLVGKAIQWCLWILTWPVSAIRARNGAEPKSKTVLVSGGATIQALQIARNLHRNGFRVVLCEVGDRLPPARFSVAVARYYPLPRPESCPQYYVRALCDVASKEQASYYVPISQATAAYYDAMAKPHLERLGCWCFCPSVREVWAVEGVYEFLDMVSQMGLPIPICYRVTDRQQVMTLYERGAFHQDPYVMIGVGSNGTNGSTNGYRKVTVDLAAKEVDLMRECLQYKISEQKPWVILQQPDGYRVVACAAVKENHVLSCVSCRLNGEGMSPVVDAVASDVQEWVHHFLSHLPLKMTGHITFQFVVPYAGRLRKSLVPLGCRVGVSMPALWARHGASGAPWRRCPHVMRHQTSKESPTVTPRPLYWLHQQIAGLMHHFTVDKLIELCRTIFTKEEALFVMWDPMPYFVYYHVKAPCYVISKVVTQVWPRGSKREHSTQRKQVKFLWQETLKIEPEPRRISNGVT